MPPRIQHGPPAASSTTYGRRAVVVFFGCILQKPVTVTAPTRKINAHAGTQPTSATSATDTNLHVVIQNDGQQPRTVFQVTVERERGSKPLVVRFCGIPLRRAHTAVLIDQRPVMASTRRNELIHRLVAGCCEICGQTVNLEVHHIRKLADLNKPGRTQKPAWMHLMAMRRRKTLVICRRCREDIHAVRATTPMLITGEPGVRANSHAPFGKRPTENDPNHGHLAGGRLHSAGGLGKRIGRKADTAAQGDPTWRASIARSSAAPTSPASSPTTPSYCDWPAGC